MKTYIIKEERETTTTWTYVVKAETEGEALEQVLRGEVEVDGMETNQLDGESYYYIEDEKEDTDE